MDPVKVLLLLLLINSIPFLFIAAFPEAGKWPLDNNRVFIDGFRVLGRHKTVAGFLSGVLAGMLVGMLLGFPVWAGFIAGFLSLTGDSFSSFIKRRLGAPEGTNLPVLDQVFESGLPLFFFHYLLPIGWLPTGGGPGFFYRYCLFGHRCPQKAFFPAEESSDPLCSIRQPVSAVARLPHSPLSFCEIAEF